MLDILNNNWFIGLVGGVISSLIASTLAGLLKMNVEDKGCSYGCFAFAYALTILGVLNVLMIGVLFFMTPDGADAPYTSFLSLFGDPFGYIVIICVILVLDMMAIGKLFFGMEFNI